MDAISKIEYFPKRDLTKDQSRYSYDPDYKSKTVRENGKYDGGYRILFRLGP